MAPAAEGTYSTRLITCHACAETEKVRADMRSSPEEFEAGMHIAIHRDT